MNIPKKKYNKKYTYLNGNEMAKALYLSLRRAKARLRERKTSYVLYCRKIPLFQQNLQKLCNNRKKIVKKST